MLAGLYDTDNAVDQSDDTCLHVNVDGADVATVDDSMFKLR